MSRLLYEIHSGLAQEAPGDSGSTRRAWQLLDGLPPQSRVLDLGCGPGRQTLDLAAAGGVAIWALDRHRPYLEVLRGLVAARGLSGRIQLVQGDMAAPPFAQGSFDVLWAEGAIYVLGFDAGLRAWRPLLREGGWLVCTELTWFQEEVPAELRRFWAAAYPGMRQRRDNARAFEVAGYRLESHFSLPAVAWEAYYGPLERRLIQLRRRFRGDGEALALLAEEAREIELYRRYGACYGYECYLARAL